MELLRALACLAEPPSDLTVDLTGLLDLGKPPSEADFTETFVLQLYPYASVYLGPEGMLGGEARDRIAGFWRVIGATPPAEPDHLTVLLALYARFRDLATSPERNPDEQEDVAERWRHQSRAFLWEHLLSWMPFYLARVREIGAPFYRDWSECLLQTLQQEAEIFQEPEPLPLHLRQASALVDPRDDARAFLPSLLSPVRSGLILTRDDLARASRELAFVLRLGERRFMLETLLDQAASETLNWLATEARRQAELWQKSSQSWPLIANAWQQRALSSVRLLEQL